MCFLIIRSSSVDILLINCQHFRCDQCKPHVLIQINLKLAAFILGNLNLLLDHRSIKNLFSLALKPLFMWSLSAFCMYH